MTTKTMLCDWISNHVFSHTTLLILCLFRRKSTDFHQESADNKHACC